MGLYHKRGNSEEFLLGVEKLINNRSLNALYNRLYVKNILERTSLLVVYNVSMINTTVDLIKIIAKSAAGVLEKIV